jgi:hypothetical protein
MKTNLFVIVVLAFHFSAAQSPFVKQWDYRFGGNGYDYITSFQQTSDGGFILGGYSGSGISGDKTQPSWGNLDYWIVKTDASGIKQWDKRFGGIDNDILSTVEQTTDGGYILGGYSDSQANGDKTQTSRGFDDYWIVRTDSLGNKIWDKRYGGADDELLATILQTSDKGFILGGYSGSGVGGDKTQPNRGFHDYWIVKTDSIGTVLWDKDFGSTDYDFLTNLMITDDGGFLLGGASSSPAAFDKSQNVWGANDAWIIKTDSLGNKQWDADYGGFDYDQVNSFCKTSDGGYLLGCYSASNTGGNKTQNVWGIGDVWLVKITSAGVIQWDKDIGALNIEDGIGSVFQNSDGSYYVICNSFSGIGGDKTENNLGLAQAWVVKTDSVGNKLWDKTILTNPDQKIYPMMIRTDEGCYAIAEATYGDVAGDKTQPNWDNTFNSTDFWIIRYCDTTALTSALFTATNNICPGTCTDFSNLSVNATSYQWFFPGANPPTSSDVNPQNICYANPGNYDVTLIATSAGTSDTLFIGGYITVYPYPNPQGIFQSGDTLFANAGASSYQWYHAGNIIPGATDYYYVAPESGNYNLVATDQNGCEVEAAIFDVAAGIQNVFGSRDFVAYPSPAEKTLTISNPKKEAAEISIFNILGEKIMDEKVQPQNLIQLNIEMLPAGIYSLHITADRKIFSKNFTKQ